MRKRIIAGNWKMNKSVGEALDFVQQVLPRLEKRDDLEIVICPPFTALHAVGKALEGSKVQLGAQDVYYEDWGARTGEISPPMLCELGVKYVIAGHSERRKYFGETDELVNRKVKAILAASMTPIMCIGETLEEREAGRAKDVVLSQLKAGLHGLSVQDMGKVVIAYEPVWAIGTGRHASPSDVKQMHRIIRESLGELGSEITVLYGGSLTPENIQELTAVDEVDGGLIGGASLKPESFLGIIEKAFRR